MAGMGRASSFLPTIKCSMCAREIEIFQMGDHVCGGSGEPTPPPDSNGNFSIMPYKSNMTNGPSYLKPGRTMPPRVDTSAANRTFFRAEELTPVSLSPSRSVSPLTPSDGRQSPFGKSMRSAARPLQRRPPSPEPLSSNLDSPFPPFPPAKSPAPNRSQSRGGYGGMGNNRFAESDSRYAPVSPRTATEGGLMQRMNTIAPGPFDPNGRRRPNESKSDRSHKRQGTIGSLRDMTMSSATSEVGASIRRPSTAGPGHSRTSTNSSNESRNAIPPPRVPRNNGYGGFGPPPGAFDPEPMSADSRSQTFPLRSDGTQASMRRPSEPGPGPRMRRPSNESYRETMDERSTSRSPSGSRGRKQSFSGPDTSRPPPPRAPSLIRSRVDGRLEDAPPVPANINLATEFGIGNPYHTPSESQSSNASGSSSASKASSTSSPPLSAGPRQSRRRPSDTSKMDVLMADLQSSMASLNPREVKTSPPRNRQYARGLQPPNNPFMRAPESPMDPAIQGGRLSPSPSRNAERPRTAPENKPVRRPTTAKGNCKGCGEPIKGPSVKSADGRLTGRYHKQCFMCKTCSEPFQTSTFYVINDAPYCEHHYHKLNGSICSTCDRGIEGQCLEAEGKQKYHPQCLTCADCKRSLRGDYFEMNGRVYCERDAFRRAQQSRFLGPGSAGGGSNRMERRTTRLMMMV